MSDARLEDLEVRYAHQELALDNLTRQVLEQAETIRHLQAELEHLKSLLRELAPSATAPPTEETPPPHY